jgi:PAS domain-containing protein
MHSLAPRALPAMPVDGIFQALPDTAFRLDSNGLILEFNAAAMVEVGVGAGAGRPIQTAFNCDGAEPFTAALRQLADSGATVTLEYACSGCGGGIHHEARLTPLPDGKVLLLIRDITSRRLIEQALRDSDAKFRDLADNVSDVLWIRSPDMQEVHYVSPGFERIWGRPMPLLYGNPQQWVDFIVPEDRERVTATFAGLTRDVRSLDIEYRILRPHGEVRWIRARGYQVRVAPKRHWTWPSASCATLRGAPGWRRSPPTCCTTSATSSTASPCRPDCCAIPCNSPDRRASGARWI